MQRTKRPLSFLLAVVMLISMCAAVPFAANAEDDVSYLYYEDEAAIAGRASTGSQSCIEVDSTTTEWSDNWYVVNGEVIISSSIAVIGEVNLILADGASLTASAGISVVGTNILNIYGQASGNGTLTAKSTSGAAIGGGQWANSGTIVINGGQSEVTTATDGAEGIESKTSITINGGNHYYKAYDDGMNSAGAIRFLGGVTVVYSFGNDAVDSNYGRTGAIEIGDGCVLAYTSKGAPEEGLDCDNNSYITITGNGYAISAGANQGGGGGWGGTSSIGSAVQGYYLSTSSLSYSTGRYYTIANSSGTNLITYSMEASLSSSLSLFTAKGMTKNQSYTIKYSTTAPTDATTAWHGVYLGSTHQGTTSFTSFTAQ